MRDSNITRFEVGNFKKFDHLLVENIGQVNLITGDNNVGKTTLLEALLCSEDNLRWIHYLHQMLFYRGISMHAQNLNNAEIELPKENYLYYILRNIDEPLVCRYYDGNAVATELCLKHYPLDKLPRDLFEYRKDKYSVDNAEDWVVFSKNGDTTELQWLYYDDKAVKYMPTYWPYIGIDASYGRDIRGFEEKISFNFQDKQQIIAYLKYMIPDVLDYEYMSFGRNKLHAIATEQDNKYRPITSFGDGFQKYFRYLWTILYASKLGDGRLMIDEIDTGVHYMRMKDEWKAIFELSKQTGVQIFATTHSMDCIKAFVEAGDQMGDIQNDLRLIELEEFTGKDGNTKHTATTYNHNTLKYKLETDTNVRGGDVWK